MPETFELEYNFHSSIHCKLTIQPIQKSLKYFGKCTLPLALSRSEKLFVKVVFLDLPNRVFPYCNENP